MEARMHVFLAGEVHNCSDFTLDRATFSPRFELYSNRRVNVTRCERNEASRRRSGLLPLAGAVLAVAAGMIAGSLGAAPSASAQQQTIVCPSSGWLLGTSASEYLRGDAWDPATQTFPPTEDVIVGLAGDDRIDSFFLKDCVLGNGGQDVVFGGKGTDVAYGYEDSDWIYGGDNHDEVFGGDGDDFLYGGAGPDGETNLLDGGPGWDVCHLQGNDTIANTVNCEAWPQAIPRANKGEQTVSPAPPLPCQSGGQVMAASSGDDVSYGDVGGPMVNTFGGGIGADTARGGEYSDCLYGGPGADWISGGTYRDHIIGDTGSDTLYGGDDDDQIYGEGADVSAPESDSVDLIDGGAGDDRLYGGRGTDEIYGGPGDNDFCRGGPDDGNTDKFVGCERIRND
jgi:Ca2+-binding RTX toxin-like protein